MRQIQTSSPHQLDGRPDAESKVISGLVHRKAGCVPHRVKKMTVAVPECGVRLTLCANKAVLKGSIQIASM